MGLEVFQPKKEVEKSVKSETNRSITKGFLQPQTLFKWRTNLRIFFFFQSKSMFK